VHSSAVRVVPARTSLSTEYRSKFGTLLTVSICANTNAML